MLGPSPHREVPGVRVALIYQSWGGGGPETHTLKDGITAFAVFQVHLRDSSFNSHPCAGIIMVIIPSFKDPSYMAHLKVT